MTPRRTPQYPGLDTPNTPINKKPSELPDVVVEFNTTVKKVHDLLETMNVQSLAPIPPEVRESIKILSNWARTIKLEAAVHESSGIPRVRPKVKFPGLPVSQNGTVDKERGRSRESEAEQHGPPKCSKRLPIDEDNSDRKTDDKDSTKPEEAVSESPPRKDIDMED